MYYACTWTRYSMAGVVYNYMLALYIYVYINARTPPCVLVLTRVCLGRVARRRANKPRIRRVVPSASARNVLRL